MQTDDNSYTCSEISERTSDSRNRARPSSSSSEAIAEKFYKKIKLNNNRKWYTHKSCVYTDEAAGIRSKTAGDLKMEAERTWTGDLFYCGARSHRRVACVRVGFSHNVDHVRFSRANGSSLENLFGPRKVGWRLTIYVTKSEIYKFQNYIFLQSSLSY